MKPQAKVFALVRDKNGKPKIDGDPANLPQQILDMLSVEEITTAMEEYRNADT